MGFKSYVKGKVAGAIESEKEKRAFLKQVAEQEKEARRESFQREAIVQARNRGTQLARAKAAPRQSFFSQFAQQPARQPVRQPVRRVVKRPVAQPVRKPIRRRIKTIRRRVTPKRRKKRRTSRATTTTTPRQNPMARTMDWGF